MSDRIFLDTNILVYAHTDFDTIKQSVAQKLISDCNSFISTQVLQELANTLNRKFKHAWKGITGVVTDAIKNNCLYVNNETTLLCAIEIADRYGFSFYDSMIIAASLEIGCNTLYSEDMHDGQKIEGRLLIKNPFK